MTSRVLYGKSCAICHALTNCHSDKHHVLFMIDPLDLQQQPGPAGSPGEFLDSLHATGHSSVRKLEVKAGFQGLT